MSNLAKLLALDISGQNYCLVLDAEIYLAANGLDPLVLWNHLEDIHEHQKTVILPRARYDWVHLRFQDFKTYRERGFKKYCDLISCLLIAEQNNELLMKNHEPRPTGSAPLSKANMVAHNQSGGRGRGSDRERGRGRGRGQGRGFGQALIIGPVHVAHPHIWWNSTNDPKRIKEKTIRLDNVGEFTSQTFNDYCKSIGICVENSVAHVHTQNGLAESLIKRIQMIARPMIMKAKLPVSAWGHAVLHAATLIHIRPTSYYTYSPLHLVFGHELNISHLRIFGCAVYVSIAPPQHTKMGPQRRMGIYVRYDSPSIIRYLEPSTGDLCTARFAGCHFNESVFLTLGGDKKQLGSEISWNELSLSHLDPRTKECKQEVQRIIHLQGLANQLPDAFTDLRRVTKSHILAANALVKIDVPKEHSKIANESKASLKRGRPVGSKDKNPRKKKRACNQDGQVEVKETLEVFSIRTLDSQKEPRVPKNEEISINYVMFRKIWNRNKIDVDEAFAYNVALEVMENDKDHEPKSVLKCKNRNDWPKWKDAIEAELKSLEKREVFGPVGRTPEGVKPVGPGIDYEETYSPVVDATTFRYLISLVIQEGLDLRLMDVVTAYLYGSLDMEIFMKLLDGFKVPESCKTSSREQYAIKLNKSLYGLKQHGRMGELPKALEYLKKEFEMKDLGKTKFCLGFVIQHIRESGGISSDKEAPTIVHEDYASCIAQLKDVYIKGDRSKHILPKFFFTHDLQKSGDIIVQQIRSSDNLADLFTKALPTTTFKKLVHDIGIRRLKELK
nr:putative copia-like polyprotein [Tanacetum cinerariifolium]